jgi:asparagine synthase (glutamine-hydrolysing)
LTYISLVGFAHHSSALDTSAFEKAKVEIIEGLWNRGVSSNPQDRLREIDIDSYLCDDILVKVDRGAMAFGLETRAPFLDVRIQDLARSADLSWLLIPENKSVLKSVLSSYVNPSIYRRPKMGFGAPLADWFSTSLLDWAHTIVKESNWERVGVDRFAVSNLFDDILCGNSNDGTYLWLLLSLGYSSTKF